MYFIILFALRCAEKIIMFLTEWARREPKPKNQSQVCQNPLRASGLWFFIQHITRIVPTDNWKVNCCSLLSAHFLVNAHRHRSLFLSFFLSMRAHWEKHFTGRRMATQPPPPCISLSHTRGQPPHFAKAFEKPVPIINQSINLYLYSFALSLSLSLSTHGSLCHICFLWLTITHTHTSALSLSPFYPLSIISDLKLFTWILFYFIFYGSWFLWRPHQIRVHLQHLGHPIANDKQYGGGGHHLEPFDDHDDNAQPQQTTTTFEDNRHQTPNQVRHILYFFNL